MIDWWLIWNKTVLAVLIIAMVLTAVNLMIGDE